MEADLGAETRGIWTSGAARRADVPEGVVRQRRAEGVWQQVHRGVYADAGQVLDAAQRGWAAVLAVGDSAVAARRTAARMWELPLVDDDDPATGRQEHRHDDVHVRRALVGRRYLHPVRLTLGPGEVDEVEGCACTTVLRTLWDLTAVLREDALVCALDAALHRELVTLDQLQEEVARRRGRPGSLGFARAVGLADGRAESPLETLTRLVLLPVVPTLVPQVRVVDGSGTLLARIDLGDEERRFGVEADGREGHSGEAMVHRDRARERRVAAHAWVLERCGWYEVRRQQAALQRRVLRAWEAAGRAAGARSAS